VAAVRGARRGGGGLVAHGDGEIEQGFAAPEIEGFAVFSASPPL
jgi:hypothetical protein